ncbi:MAG: hypothetical protein PF568_03155, partial [Deltaproteobacteria bacterium]|nr:hypothetical protein [Deltaproteobacteria bacterium]
HLSVRCLEIPGRQYGDRGFFFVFLGAIEGGFFFGEGTPVPGGAAMVLAGGVKLQEAAKDKAERVFFLIDLPFSFW